MQELAEWSGPEELAAWLDVPLQTIYLWNSKGTGPRYVRAGRHVRYRRRDVESWLEQNSTPAA